MCGGYLQDELCSFNNDCKATFRFWRFDLIDIFIYFSHHFISFPPRAWTKVAKTRNTKVYGTIIFESVNDSFRNLFISENYTEYTARFIRKIILMSKANSIDGWLLNFEVKLTGEEKRNDIIDRIKTFIFLLSNSHLEILWYDSLTILGDLKWQNKLDTLNYYPFFRLSNEGIYLNYTWKPEYLTDSQLKCSMEDESSKIYVGVDCFGRGVLGGGGWNTHIAVQAIVEKNKDFPERPLSLALFAPGWSYEKFHNTQTASLSFDLNRLSFIDWLFWNNGLSMAIHDLRKKCSRISFPVHILEDGINLRTNFSLGCGSFRVNSTGSKENTKWNDRNRQEIFPTCRELVDSKNIHFITTVNFDYSCCEESSSSLEINPITSFPDLSKRYLPELSLNDVCIKFLLSTKDITETVPFELMNFDWLRPSHSSCLQITLSIKSGKPCEITDVISGLFFDVLNQNQIKRVIHNFIPEKLALFCDLDWFNIKVDNLCILFSKEFQTSNQDFVLRRYGLCLEPKLFIDNKATVILGNITFTDKNPKYYSE